VKKKNFRAEQATEDNMAHAHCMLIPKVANALSAFGTLTAFPQQQWLHERSSVLRYT
jgi:hypothetical protein